MSDINKQNVIDTNTWIKILRDDITYDNVFHILQTLLEIFDGEAFYLDLVLKAGYKTHTGVNKIFHHFGERVCKFYDITPPKDKNGKIWYQEIPLIWTYNKEKGLWLCKLKPELKKALQKLP